MRQPPEFFDDTELDLIYIARRLKDALKLESLLTSSGVDFLVEPDRYRGGIIFRSERVGAFFYVPSAALDAARRLLEANGYKCHSEEMA